MLYISDLLQKVSNNHATGRFLQFPGQLNYKSASLVLRSLLDLQLHSWPLIAFEGKFESFIQKPALHQRVNHFFGRNGISCEILPS